MQSNFTLNSASGGRKCHDFTFLNFNLHTLSARHINYGKMACQKLGLVKNTAHRHTHKIYLEQCQGKVKDTEFWART